MKKKKAQVGLFVFLLIVFAILLLFTVFYVYSSDSSSDSSIKTGSYSNKGKMSTVAYTIQSITSKIFKKPKAPDYLAYPCKAGEYDTDGDDVPDYCDNCPLHYDPFQSDYDEDGKGNVCDDDY